MTVQENKTMWQNEPDSRELSEMAADVRRSYTWKRAEELSPAIDVDEEWQKFRANHILKKEHHNGWHRWAVAASMLLLCTIGLALGWSYFREWTSPKTAPLQIESSSSKCTNDTIIEDNTKLKFRNAGLNTILQEIAARHGTQVRYCCREEIYLYVELEKSWSLQQCVDFLNHFDRVNLKLSQDNIIVAE